MLGATNLRLKGRKFHFRRKVPYTLRERFGRCELVLSLRTGDRRLAASRAREAWLAVEQVIKGVQDDVTLTRAEIDRLLLRAAAAIEWADEVRLARNGRSFDCHGDFPPNADVLILDSEAETYRRALAENDIAPARDMVQRYSSDIGRAIQEGSTDERLLGRALLRLLADKSEETARRIEAEVYRYREPFVAPDGDVSEATAVPAGDALESIVVSAHEDMSPGVGAEGVSRQIQTAPSSPSPATEDSPGLFDAAWREVIDDLIANKRWDKGKAAHADSSRKLWLGIIGDGPVASITRKTAVKFRRTVSQLPETYHRDKRWRGLTFLEMISAADGAETRGEPIARMTVKTVNRHISQLKQMWNDFVLLELVGEDLPNPFDRLHIAVKKSKHVVREERDQFTIAELRILFSAPIWTGSKSATRRKEPGSLIIRDWRFWVPLIGAFSGMRREEICALRVGDIEEMNGIWLVDLRKAKQRLKTPGSPRYVPLHDTLLKIGFLRDLVADRSADDWLFPDLTASALTNRRGEPFGKWFTPLRRELGIYRPEVVFHSFRHTVSTALHNAMGHHPFIEEIIGHESDGRQSELSRYTKETLVRNLKETIDRLDYEIDLSFLFVS